MAEDVKKKLRNISSRNYLARDFNSFRAELLDYARLYFPDQIQDFSEAGMGGLLLDMVSYVGDNLSFYLDHQFNELSWRTAIESKNIQKHLRDAGVKIRGAAPATAKVKFLFEIPAEEVNGEFRPKVSVLPVIGAGSTTSSITGTSFYLLDDLDFTEKDSMGRMIYESTLVSTNDSGDPLSFIVSREGISRSGIETEESFRIIDSYQAFREITLPDEAVTEILEVKDTDGNVYYEVESLSQDTVFIPIERVRTIRDETDFNLEIAPAPYRFISSYSFDTRTTTLTFGAGDAKSTDEDLIPDPASLSLPLYGKKRFQRFAIDPNSLLKTHTLGFAPQNTTMIVKYRHGGGLSHNVGSDTIRTITNLTLTFKSRPSQADVNLVRSSADVTNDEAASGGDRAPRLNELRSEIPTARSAQQRIITKQDLIGRIMTLPNKFGRVFRVSVRRNYLGGRSSSIYIISRDQFGNLAKSPDTLKLNLVNYLNEFRIVSDALDILDARIINLGIEFEVVSSPGTNKTVVAQTAINNIGQLFTQAKLNIDLPISLSDIQNVLLNSEGVMSLISLHVINLYGKIEDREYSNVPFDVKSSTAQQIIVGPPGTIFELKFPAHDIRATVK